MQTDQILKEFWEDNDRFADFFNTVCFGGRQVIHPEELEPHFADYPMHLFQILGNDGRDFTNEDLRTVLKNADALRSGRVQDMDRMIDAELVKYLAAFVNSEKVMKLLQSEKGEIAVCTALEEMIRDGERRGRAIGKAEGIIELLRELGTVPDELEKTIIGEKNIEVLREWLKKAARAKSVAQFQEEIHFRGI